MNTRILLSRLSLAALAFWLPFTTSARADNPSVYQGRLKIGGGTPAKDSFFDMEFRLYDMPAGGIQIAENCIAQVSVLDSNGLFRVMLDFGPNAFGSDPRWMELGVRRAGTSNPFATLTPRQRVGPVPTSLHAQSADVATSVTGVISPANLPSNVARLDTPQVFNVPPSFMPPSGVPFTVGVTTTVQNLNADLLDGLDSTQFWRRSVNGVASIIQPSDLPVDIRVQNTPVLRLQPGDSNLGWSTVLGSANNIIATGVPGSVVAGGRNNLINSNNNYCVVSGGDGNEIGVGSSGSVIGGGVRQLIGPNSLYSGIFAGYHNQTLSRFSGVLLGDNGMVGESSDFSAVMSGENNSIGPMTTYATIVSGGANQIQLGANLSAILSGQQNIVHSNAFASAIGAGQLNHIQNGANRSFLGGGDYNEIGPASYLSFLGAGTHNRIEFNAPYAAILGGYYNLVRSNASSATVLGGVSSVAGAPFAIAAGHQAKAEHSGSIVLADGQYADFMSSKANEFAVRAAGGVRFETGGAGLTVDGMKLTSGGGGLVLPAGSVNTSNLVDGAVLAEILDNDGAGSGLDADRLDGFSSEDFWRLTGNAGTTAGVNFLGTTDDEPLMLKVNSAVALRLYPDPLFQGGALHSPNLIGGSLANGISDGNGASVIAGGGSPAPVNIGVPFVGPVLSGGLNYIDGTFATLSGGGGNAVRAHGSAIGGGNRNQIAESAAFSLISGGDANRLGTNAAFSSIGGGRSNQIANFSLYATVAGGLANTASAQAAVASGGTSNTVSAAGGVIAGGLGNTIQLSADSASIGGGDGNLIEINSDGSTISGGAQNAVRQNDLYATISGGGNNDIKTGAHYGTIAGGFSQTIQADAYAATLGGGTYNLVASNADFATIPGGNGAKAQSHGQLAYAGGPFAVAGDAQTSQYVLRGTSTGTNLTELFLDGSGQRMKVPPGAVWTFDILIVAKGSEPFYMAGYQIRGVVANFSGITLLLTDPEKTVLFEPVLPWDANADADDAHSALVVKVTGPINVTGTTVRWVASVRTVELVF